MKVLLTGSSGFIGSRVCKLLLENGHTVLGIDNMSDAYDVRLKEWRLLQLQNSGAKGFTYAQADITDRAALTDLWHQHGPFDAVINLAARAGVRQSIEAPLVYYQTNVEGSLNILELCRREKVDRYILASTSSLYGEAPTPFRESQTTDYPLSPYAASKKAAEAMAYTYHKLFGISATVLRYFTVYGPAGRPDMSIFRFIKWISEGEPLVLFGDGSQERDFTYVQDIAQGTVSALGLSGHNVINLGSDRPVSLKSLIQLLEHKLGKTAIISHRAKDPTDTPKTWADISKAKDLLGWIPRTTLEDGTQACVEWYQKNRQWARTLAL